MRSNSENPQRKRKDTTTTLNHKIQKKCKGRERNKKEKEKIHLKNSHQAKKNYLNSLPKKYQNNSDQNRKSSNQNLSRAL